MNWIFDLLIPLFGVVLPMLGVGLVVRTLLKKTGDVGLFLFYGAGIHVVLQTLFSWVGVSITMSQIVLIIVGYIGLFYALWRNRTRFHKKMFFVPMLVVLITLPFFIRTFSVTMYTWDSVAFWMPKMYALTQKPTARVENFTYFNHPEYPLFVPMIAANTYSLFRDGEIHEAAAKVSLFAFVPFWIYAMYTGFRKFGIHPVGAFLSLFTFLMLFVVRDHISGEYAGTADLFIGLYAGLGMLLLLLKRPFHAVAMFLFLPWIKTEGLVWFGAAAACIGLLVLYKKEWKNLLKLIAFFAIGTTWYWYTKMSGDTSQYGKFSEIYARPWAEYAAYAIHSFREQFRLLNKWGMLWYAWILSFGTQLKRVTANWHIFIPLFLIFTQLISYLVIFTITPEEQATFISASISRLSLHLAPSAFGMMIYLLCTKEKGKDSA